MRLIILIKPRLMNWKYPEWLWPGPAQDHDSGDGELPKRQREHCCAGGFAAVYGDGCDTVIGIN